MKPEMAPVLPSSNVVTKALGISATIPEKIINDIPLPIPLCVICSPSHIKKIVPATIVVTVEILKKKPGFITRFDDDNANTILKRYDVYMEITKPVLAFYSKNKNFHEVDGSMEIADISQKIEEILKV